MFLSYLIREREKEPRFAPPGTFEYEFGMRWKQIEEIEKSRIEQVKKDTEDARLKLEDEMQNALYEYQAEQIRQGNRSSALCFMHCMNTRLNRLGMIIVITIVFMCVAQSSNKW